MFNYKRLSQGRVHLGKVIFTFQSLDVKTSVTSVNTDFDQVNYLPTEKCDSHLKAKIHIWANYQYQFPVNIGSMQSPHDVFHTQMKHRESQYLQFIKQTIGLTPCLISEGNHGWGINPGTLIHLRTMVRASNPVP